MNDPTLTTFWIETNDPLHGLGFGVTARSISDAFHLLKEAGFLVDQSTSKVRSDVFPHEVNELHVAPNAGPVVFRGVWYPRLSL